MLTLFICWSPHSFQDYDKFDLRYPNFNFNVSHHGDYVAIASEPICIVGVDIVSYDVPQGETITEFIQFFSSHFSSLEWDNIVNAGTSDDVLIEFYRYDMFILYLGFFFPLSRNISSNLGLILVNAGVPAWREWTTLLHWWDFLASSCFSVFYALECIQFSSW